MQLLVDLFPTEGYNNQLMNILKLSIWNRHLNPGTTFFKVGILNFRNFLGYLNYWLGNQWLGKGIHRFFCSSGLKTADNCQRISGKQEI